MWIGYSTLQISRLNYFNKIKKNVVSAQSQNQSDNQSWANTKVRGARNTVDQCAEIQHTRLQWRWVVCPQGPVSLCVAATAQHLLLPAITAARFLHVYDEEMTDDLSS